MIVGGYDLHLYCRNEQCGGARADVIGWAAQFMGDNERDAKAQARKAGWRFTAGDVDCPRCAKGLPVKPFK